MTTDTEGVVWAFPFKMGEYECTGMTLRDYFAAAALQGMLAKELNADYAASHAYDCADAMMKARKEGV